VCKFAEWEQVWIWIYREWKWGEARELRDGSGEYVWISRSGGEEVGGRYWVDVKVTLRSLIFFDEDLVDVMNKLWERKVSGYPPFGLRCTREDGFRWFTSYARIYIPNTYTHKYIN